MKTFNFIKYFEISESMNSANRKCTEMNFIEKKNSSTSQNQSLAKASATKQWRKKLHNQKKGRSSSVNVEKSSGQMTIFKQSLAKFKKTMVSI